FHLHVVYMRPKKNEMPASPLQSMLETHYGSQVISWASRIEQDMRRAQRLNQGIVMIEDLAALDQYEATGSTQCDVEAIRRISERISTMPPRERKGLLVTSTQVLQRLQTGTEWRKLTIHRHFPSEGLDSKLGFLDFRRSRVERLIARGFTDTAAHDCEVNQC